MPAPDSHEAFIAEHNWGYARQRNGGTKEYRVEHAPWKVWASQSAEFEGDVGSLYGERFVECLSAGPKSAFVADGSAITVGRGLKVVEESSGAYAKTEPVKGIEPTASLTGRD